MNLNFCIFSNTSYFFKLHSDLNSNKTDRWTFSLLKMNAIWSQSVFIQKNRSVSKKSEQLWASKRADARRQRCCKPLNLWWDIFLQFCLESSKQLLSNRERLVFWCVPVLYRTTANLDRFTAPNIFIAMVSWRSYCSFFFNLRFMCKYLK